MSELSVGDGVSPRSRIVPTEDLKIHFDFLVYSFGFETTQMVTASTDTLGN